MFFSNVLIAMLASGALVVARPGGGGEGHHKGHGKPEEPKKTAQPVEKETACATELITHFQTGESKTTEKVTTTVYIPITSVVNKPFTTVKPVPYKSTGKSKKIDTVYETYVETKVVPITTVIYSTHADTKVKTKTAEHEVPFTVDATSYETKTGNNPETFVTSSASATVKEIEKIVPFTSPSVETKTQCTTKDPVAPVDTKESKESKGTKDTKGSKDGYGHE